MKHLTRIKTIEKKVGSADENISVIIRYISRKTGEVLREDVTKTAGHKGKPAVVIADEASMKL